MAVLRLVSVQTEDDSLEDGAPPSRLYPMPVVKGRSFDLLKVTLEEMMVGSTRKTDTNVKFCE